MGIRQLVNRMLFPNTCSSEAYVSYLRKCGVVIGEGTYFVKPKNTVVDIQRASFVEIGRNVSITSGVIILAHDWSYSVLARRYNDAPAKQRMTKIGDNVFIGMNSIILMGSNIGNNVIIGAGSVVSGKIESDSVYAGNPAKRLCTIEEHYRKLKADFENSTYIFLSNQLNKRGGGIFIGGYGNICFFVC